MRFCVPVRLPTCKLIFSQKCTEYETLLNICRTSDNKHHKAYLQRSKQKKNTRKFKKIPSITIAAALRAKKFKMISKAIEKMLKNGKEKELLHLLITTNSNIFAQTLHHQVKKQRYLNLVDSGRRNKYFCGNSNMGKFSLKIRKK